MGIFTRWLAVPALIFGGATGFSGTAFAQTAREAPAQHLTAVQNARAQMLTVGTPAHAMHLFPSRQMQATIPSRSLAAPDLIYHSGGPIMPRANIYIIFWVPAKLQNGKPAVLSSNFTNVQSNLLGTYASHGLSSNNTQYYQTVNGVTTYVAGVGGLVAAITDTTAYPASGCTDSATPGNCLTDAQITAEIEKDRVAHNWPTGLSNIYFLYTALGEGSCFNSSGASCAYTQYCAYHSYYTSSGKPVVYANEPVGDPNYCAISGVPTPDGAYPALTASSASHELTEAVTDPMLNAWFNSSGDEIGDICAYNYGTATWSNPATGVTSNQMWSGFYFELQREYDNHTSDCVLVGP